MKNILATILAAVFATSATLLAVAELERSTIIERMQAGKAVARTKAGFREGRPPIPEAKKRHAVDLVRAGHSYKEAAEMTGISISTIVRAAKKKTLFYIQL